MLSFGCPARQRFDPRHVAANPTSMPPNLTNTNGARPSSVTQGVPSRVGAGCGWPRELRAALARCSAGDPRAEVVEDLNRRPLEHGCDAVRDFPEQHDARHGNVV